MDIKKGDIVKLKGKTLYTLESTPINGKKDSYVTIQNIESGKCLSKRYDQLTLVRTLEELINRRFNAVNCTSDKRKIVGDLSNL